MPCYDSRNSPENVRRDTLTELKPALERLRITTALACQFCLLPENKGHDIPDYARAWWAEHKQVDAQRNGHQMTSLDV